MYNFPIQTAESAKLALNLWLIQTYKRQYNFHLINIWPGLSLSLFKSNYKIIGDQISIKPALYLGKATIKIQI